MNVERDQLRKLPIAEKLRIVEQLWDDIAASDEPLVLRDWHIAEGSVGTRSWMPIRTSLSLANSCGSELTN